MKSIVTIGVKLCAAKNAMSLLTVANKYGLPNAKLKLTKYAKYKFLPVYSFTY